MVASFFFFLHVLCFHVSSTGAYNALAPSIVALPSHFVRSFSALKAVQFMGSRIFEESGKQLREEEGRKEKAVSKGMLSITTSPLIDEKKK